MYYGNKVLKKPVHKNCVTDFEKPKIPKFFSY